MATLAVAVAVAVAGCAGGDGDADPATTSPATVDTTVATTTPLASSADLAALEVLDDPPREPDVLGRFASEYFHMPGADNVGPYPSGPPMAPGTATSLTEDEAPDAIRRHYGDDHEAADRALAVFNRPDARRMIPDPKARAAFSALVGTVLEPAIDLFLSGDRFETLDTAEPPPDRLALTLGTATEGPGGRRVISLNAAYFRSASFAQATATIGREINHDDFAGGPAEDGILGVLTAIAHLQVLARDPGLADEPTAMARLNNTQAMALLDSRVPGSPDITILADPPTLFPGGDPAYDGIGFWSLAFPGQFTGPLAVSPELDPVLRRELSSIVEPATELPEKLAFSEELAALLDEHLALRRAGLTPSVRVGLELALGLVSPEDIGAATGMDSELAAAAYALDGEAEVPG